MGLHGSQNVKKASSCSRAIYVLRCVTDYCVQSGSTVNICAIDVCKAFNKMNHHGLFVQLIKRHIPINLLSLLEHWFSIGMACVKWTMFGLDGFRYTVV